MVCQQNLAINPLFLATAILLGESPQTTDLPSLPVLFIFTGNDKGLNCSINCDELVGISGEIGLNYGKARAKQTTLSAAIHFLKLLDAQERGATTTCVQQMPQVVPEPPAGMFRGGSRLREEAFSVSWSGDTSDIVRPSSQWAQDWLDECKFPCLVWKVVREKHHVQFKREEERLRRRSRLR